MDLARTGTAIGAAWPGQTRRLTTAAAGIIAIVAIALAVAFAMTRGFGGTDQAVAPFADNSYSQVEALRGAHGFGSTVNDGSYDKVEALRGAKGFVASEPDGSYDKVEALRADPPGN